MRRIIVIAHDMRSTYNIGSLFRTADAMGVEMIYLTGYTAYPAQKNDERLPHITEKLDRQIEKTALGATKTVKWQHEEDVQNVIGRLSGKGYTIAALEQFKNSIRLNEYAPPEKIALLLGTELTGLPNGLIEKADVCIEISMFGKKESLNVVQAAAIALYHLRFA